MGPTTFRLPHLDGPTVRAIALRALVLWLLVRATLLMLAFLLASVSGGEGVQASSSAAPHLAIILVVAFLTDIDVRITREALFLAHLGIGRRHIATVAATVALAGELAVLLVSMAIF